MLQIRLDADARRALSALELTAPEASLSDLVGEAIVHRAAQRHIPVKLSREQEMQLARLSLGPCTVEEFRKTGHSDAFLAGLAIALASDRTLPRDALLAVAGTLAPGEVTEAAYRRWLDATPISLPRLFKLVDAERGIAAAQPAGPRANLRDAVKLVRAHRPKGRK